MEYRFSFFYGGHVFVYRNAFTCDRAIIKFRNMCNCKYRNVEITEIHKKIFGKWKLVYKD